jgi:6-pyruvoyltetrahydropterin/6-carboxytetrahydropterin synthase
MYELIITDHFSSAHYLREYRGACENLHGHTWRVEVAIASETLDHIGLVIDFKDFKLKLKALMERWDHVCLNELPEFKEMNPSTENMARWLYKEFSKELPNGIFMNYVRVWESDSASVRYRE